MPAREGGRSDRWRTWVRRGVALVVDREPVLVTLMAIMVSLSAFAVWQATRASERADDTAAQMRVVDSQRQVWNSRRQTSVDHDVEVLASYCETLVQHNIALYQLLSRNPDASAVIPTELSLEALSNLSLGGVPEDPCGSDVSATARSVIDRVEASLPTYPGDATVLEAELKGAQSDELWLMTAGLLFAVALFGLIAIDLLGDRAQRPRRLGRRAIWTGQRIALTVAVVAFLVGIGIVLLLGDLLHVALLALGLGLLVSSRLWRGSRWIAATSRLDVRHPHWWAEVLGAITLVAFSASALGLTTVSGEERELRADSEAQRAVAAGLSEQAQVEAGRQLSAVAELSSADAAIASAALSGDVEGGQAAGERRDKQEKFADELARSLNDQVDARAKSAGTQGCPVFSASARTDARSLMSTVTDSAANLPWYVHRMQEPALACNVVADESAASADRWSSRVSFFTIALVLLGLSGFLLALAADLSRSVRISNWLLHVGAIGAIFGLVIAIVVPLRSAVAGNGLSGRGLTDFARGVAGGQANGCNVSLFTQAIARQDEYGPAYAARGLARACQENANPAAGVLTSDVKDDAVAAFRDDFVRAAELGPRTPATLANLGWADILSGLHGGEAWLLEDGVRLTRESIAMVEESDQRPAFIHAARFNEALGSAAQGDVHTATQLYRTAVDCLDPASSCRGGGVVDVTTRTQTILWALADIELLPDSVADDLAPVVVTSYTSGGDPTSSTEGAELDVFPQEVQITTGSADPVEVSVLWYYRPDDNASWGVLEHASEQTLTPGDHFGHPISADVALAVGEYRADVYADGERLARLTAQREEALVSVRESVTDLAAAVVTPDDWDYVDYYAGTDVTMGPSGNPEVRIHREEGVQLRSDVTRFLDRRLGRWLTTVYGARTAKLPHSSSTDHFAGLSPTAVRTYQDIPLTAAIGFSPYGSSAWCGGGLLMAAVGGPDSRVDDDVRVEVFDSITVDGERPRLPDLGARFESDHFAVDIPDGWDAAARPIGAENDNAFQARNCDTTANVLVTVENLGEATVRQIVDQSLAGYGVEADFPRFRLLSRRSTDVPGSDDAVELVFAWGGKKPVLQKQIYAARGRKILYLTFTEHDPGSGRPDPAADVLANSLELRW